ncbi:MAG: nucleotidyltransferase family protein [Kineosporiaceae bacterium]
MTASATRVAAILLAAGAGRRLGTPKALLHDAHGVPWVERAARRLVTGGCRPVLVVVGARAAEAASLVPPALVPPSDVVEAVGWHEGMGASLRAGLVALEERSPAADAALVALVDTPGMTTEVVRRVLAAASGPSALARAAFDGVPGHPVLLGREHWTEVRAAARGDAGARDYLRNRPVRLVECGDVGSGLDVDTRGALAAVPPIVDA